MEQLKNIDPSRQEGCRPKGWSTQLEWRRDTILDASCATFFPKEKKLWPVQSFMFRWMMISCLCPKGSNPKEWGPRPRREDQRIIDIRSRGIFSGRLRDLKTPAIPPTTRIPKTILKYQIFRVQEILWSKMPG